ncbi:hypothetical protein CPB83DRAFT_755542 [Crepidotus variabilis]|uniref:Yeast cell wall synthesis Kre9/Knh1-like N-terminal domain-containing protein n=1 Tax=Crepidotus variabilis TaxID=179855 RepID=A0A9P6JVQ4_9AGAR|nr:hypothetical protein CPB83DRAFT_755542 [Crepidotus variabilis]
MRAAVALLAFASSAFAYTVTFPGQNQPWGDSGSNKLTWTKVSTDKQNFTVVLDNQSISGFTPQVLAALVDGASGSTDLNPPNPGWQDGSGYRINLVQDENNLSTIYAQSTQFDIKPSNGSSSTTSKKCDSFFFP